MRKINSKNLWDIFVIEWQDISKTTNDEAFDEHRTLESCLCKMVTVGVLYKESSSCYLFAQEYYHYSGKLVVRDWITIPKSVITNMHKVGRLQHETLSSM